MARTLFAVVAIAFGLCLPPAHADVPPIKQPSWVELTVGQREILAPLAGEWDRLESARRKKWLSIAERYPGMKAEEQARVQRRMLDWVKLSPEQRKQAREKYRNLRKSSPERKETIVQKWQEYKELPEEEKQRLQAEAAARPKGRPQRTAPGSGKKSAAPTPLPTLAPLAAPPAAPPPAPGTETTPPPPPIGFPLSGQ